MLDTHALIWWLTDDDRLGIYPRRLIAAPENEVLVSVASLWEIVVKLRIGKLAADVGEIVEAVRRASFTFLDIAPDHLSTLADLPAHHRDPFDHLLIAQAIAEDATFISGDGHVARYQVRAVAAGANTAR